MIIDNDIGTFFGKFQGNAAAIPWLEPVTIATLPSSFISCAFVIDLFDLAKIFLRRIEIAEFEFWKSGLDSI
jgi:hypothetical protein